ncbi:MAG TPA: NAD(+) diphosphatase [Jiangellales bacterium]|nr:NAD(+) diphosphatase [Jiangellales bacterium]
MTPDPAPYALRGPLALSRAGVDRAAERRGDDAWLAAAWRDPGSRVLVVSGGRVAVDGDGLATVPPDRAPAGERYLLGVDDGGRACLAVHASEWPAGSRAAGLRELGAVLGDVDAGLVVHAVALANWHRTHTHCPRCGARTRLELAGHLRRCEADGSEHHPRTDPAVIVAVVDSQERCLLGRGAGWPEGRFSTLAGFVEPGEPLERAVAREVREETGIEVGACWYAGSQPWPFPSSLMVGFWARARTTEVAVDGEEIVEARWFSRDGLTAALRSGEVLMPPSVSIARRLVEAWFGGELPGGEAWR